MNAKRARGDPVRGLTTVLLGAAVALLLSFASVRHASALNSYSNKAIRWIIPFPAGGAIDSICRIVGQQVSAHVG